jgi:hypothetical protein
MCHFGACAGMAFQSGVAAVNSTPHLALTWLVAVVLVACILLFVGMLSIEVWRSVQFARRMHAVRRASIVSSPVRRASRASREYTDNPLNARRSSSSPLSGAAVTVASRPREQPPVETPMGARGHGDAIGRAPAGLSDASARVFGMGRPPPPPPPREGSLGGGVVTTTSSSLAAVRVAALDSRSCLAPRGPQAAAAPPEAVAVGRDGRVKKLRSAMPGPVPPPSLALRSSPLPEPLRTAPGHGDCHGDVDAGGGV